MAAATAQLTLLPAIPGQAEADHRQTGDHAHRALPPRNILHVEHRKSFQVDSANARSPAKWAAAATSVRGSDKGFASDPLRGCGTVTG